MPLLRHLRHLWKLEQEWVQMTTAGERFSTMFGSRGPASAEEHALLLTVTSAYRGPRGMLRMLPMVAGYLIAIVAIQVLTGDVTASFVGGLSIGLIAIGLLTGRRASTMHDRLAGGTPPQAGPIAPIAS